MIGKLLSPINDCPVLIWVGDQGRKQSLSIFTKLGLKPIRYFSVFPGLAILTSGRSQEFELSRLSFMKEEEWLSEKRQAWGG